MGCAENVRVREKGFVVEFFVRGVHTAVLLTFCLFTLVGTGPFCEGCDDGAVNPAHYLGGLDRSVNSRNKGVLSLRPTIAIYPA